MPQLAQGVHLLPPGCTKDFFPFSPALARGRGGLFSFSPQDTRALRSLIITGASDRRKTMRTLKLYLFRPVDWDVFVRDLNRQLGTPSHWLPVDSCKKRKKGRPSGHLHSDAQVSQQETPKLCTSVSEHRVWHSEGGKKNCVLCVYSPSGKQSFPSPLSVTSRLEQATREFLGNLPKVPTLFPTFSALFKLPKHLKRL